MLTLRQLVQHVYDLVVPAALFPRLRPDVAKRSPYPQFKWLWNALHGVPIVVEGGQQTRDVAFIDDVVRGWMLAIQAPAEKVVGQKFFVGACEKRHCRRRR